MTVLLRRSDDLPTPDSFVAWAGLEAAPSALDPTRLRPDLAADLERAFETAREDWWSIARDISQDAGAHLAHMPACAANVSDFGVMLGWSRLVETWAAEAATTLVICDDPCVFRHLSERAGVQAGRPPALGLWVLRLQLRGALARLRYVAHAARASLLLRYQRAQARPRAPALLVYGHPASTVDGRDAYFGDLMLRLSGLGRVLHVDCPPKQAAALYGGGRTISLHAFGTLGAALSLVRARWRPNRVRFAGRNGWLIRRAAEMEGGTAQAASIRWQIACQRNWLRTASPCAVAWPWENHAWERDLVRTARAARLHTVGYQHSVIGRHMLNYSPASAPDGPSSAPDVVLCTGTATRDQLERWGMPAHRLDVGGALRFAVDEAPSFDPTGPVFVALPFDGRIAGEMVEATKRLDRPGAVMIKDHPMMPFAFAETSRMRRADGPFAGQSRLAAVVYAATTVGLEAILAGIPALRFRPRGSVALDILPEGVSVPAVDSSTLAAALAAPQAPPRVPREQIFAPIDLPLWRRHLVAM